MTETDIEEPTTEAEEDPKTDIEEEPTPEVIESLLKIETWDDVFRVVCIAKGIDPDQVQGMAKFLNPDSVDETSYYPNQLTSMAMAQLRLFGEAFYKGEEWNEYELAADLLGTGFKGFKGFKSEQYTVISSGQPNLDKLKALPADVQKGILSGVFNRGGSKE